MNNIEKAGIAAAVIGLGFSTPTIYHSGKRNAEIKTQIAPVERVLTSDELYADPLSLCQVETKNLVLDNSSFVETVMEEAHSLRFAPKCELVLLGKAEKVADKQGYSTNEITIGDNSGSLNYTVRPPAYLSMPQKFEYLTKLQPLGEVAERRYFTALQPVDETNPVRGLWPGLIAMGLGLAGGGTFYAARSIRKQEEDHLERAQRRQGELETNS